MISTNKKESLKTLSAILFLISLPQDGFKQRTRLQKFGVLIEYDKNIDLGLDFSSYYYGPYSKKLSNLIDFMSNADLIKEISEDKDDYKEYKYSLTLKGKELLEEISKKNLSKKEKRSILSLWNDYKNLTTKSLVSKAKQASGISSVNN